ncbi:hypothetical protein BTO02_25235 [Paraburkholderia sp. SOS3]|nr:hypothetical protein BTO02_25235 [Paraburkholderia sp. SOS3]
MPARVRAHVDFIEYTPFVVVPMALLEYAGGSPTSLRGLGAANAVGRIRYLRGFVLAVAWTAAGRCVLSRSMLHCSSSVRVCSRMVDFSSWAFCASMFFQRSIASVERCAT